MRKLRAVLVLAATLAAGVLVGSAADAVLTARTGTFSDRQFFRAETSAWSTGSGTYTNVPGMAFGFTVPSGTSRLVDARYTAESACTGTSGWCTVRVILIYPTGAALELSPASGTDFAFDTADPDPGDIWEAHAIERSSPFLPAGSYRLYVQAKVVFGATSIRLDEHHLAVELVRP